MLSPVLLLACFWVMAASLVALLPMRHQYAPGLTLLIAAPVLLLFIGLQHGWVPAALGTLAFVSMFRNPLIYLGRRALGRPVTIPRDPGEAA